MKKVKKWFVINKLSVNFKKTNIMVVKSLHKRQVNMIIKLKSKNNSTHIIEKKITYVKYLGVFIRLFYGKPCILYFFIYLTLQNVYGNYC